MNSLSLSVHSGIESPPGIVSYTRRSHFQKQLCREPRPRYARVNPAVDARGPVGESKSYPFRKDLLWKSVIEDLSEAFLRFFFPDIAAGKDPDRKIEFLDKELLQLFPPEDDRFVPRHVDKLLKIPMRDGSTVILHCEVQGDRQSHFPARMYRYFGRLWDKYPQAVEAIAILTDGDPGFRPQPYREGRKTGDNHHLCYRYKVHKVLDQAEEILERNDNPFALVILITKAALKRKNGDYTEEEYFQRKLELANRLKNKLISETQAQALMIFLKSYLPLEDKALEQIFNKQLKEGSETMGTVEFLINETKRQVRAEEKLSFVKSLIANTNFDDEQIATLAMVDADFVSMQRKSATLSS